MTAASPARRPRADALRNRTRITAAAADVFAERGFDATVAQVAERAGVGNATVFRNFATKEELLSEVATTWLESWAAEVRRRLADDPRPDVLRDLVGGVLERLREDRLTLDLLRAGNLDDRMRGARAEVERLFDEAVDRGVDAGVVAAGTTYADLSLLVLGMAGRLSELDETSPERWRHAADLAWAAVRA